MNSLGKTHFIFSVENPVYNPKVNPPSHEEALNWLKSQGEDAIEAMGHYGSPERSIIVRNPKNVEGLKQLAEDIGQESAIFSDGTKHQLHFLNGSRRGETVHGKGTQIFAEPPSDMFTSYIDEQGDRVHFRHNFQKESSPLSHPHSYDWHEGHTIHNDVSLRKDEPSAHAHQQAHGPTPPSGNDQAGGNNSGKFHEIMGKFGTITPGEKTNLKFYNDLDQHLAPIENHVKESGYNHYLAGGKFGKPDLANKNYNTKHLMIYDPSPDSGASFGQENYTKAWRLAHELAHAQTLPKINEIYGEGRRLGKLGVRTPREMKRAVHWEDMAVQRQREIMKHLGYDIKDEDFNKERNTVLADATHRAITGQFTDPHEMGFMPHDKHIPLDHALKIIDDHAKSMGLRHDDDTLAAQRQSLGKSEELIKSPLPYTDYDSYIAERDGLPDLMHNDQDYTHLKSVKLPNGLEYRKFKQKRSLPESQRLVHALYDPKQPWEPLAYMETAHEEDASQKAGYHPHAVKWSEVSPEHRGKGLGRQLYLATLVHGTHKLTSDDRISPDAHKMWTSFKNTPGLGGKISMYPQNNELLFSPGLTDKASERHRVFIRDATKLDHNKMFPPVNLAPKEKLAASEDTEQWLLKAIDDKAWKRINDKHNKAVVDAKSVVDDVGHIKSFKNTHKQYAKEILDSPDKIPAEKHNPDLGVSAKVIHQMPMDTDDHHDRYMAKPYHAPNERWATKWGKHPIKGWASLTTRKLFDAADMSDNCEDIAAHWHKGVPIVVSKFHPEAQETYDHPDLFPTDLAKIGILDFLTNNQDRHRGNMMHINGIPLAIDHERNFQYFGAKPGFEPGSITPQHALQQFGYEDARQISNMAQNGSLSDHLVDWWGKTGHNIKKEMQKNLKYIKDPAIKRHIEDNFNKRWDWVHDHMQNDPSMLYSKDNFPGVHTLPYVKARKKK